MTTPNARILSRIAAASAVKPTVVPPSAPQLQPTDVTWTKLDVSTLPAALIALDAQIREASKLVATLSEQFRLDLESILEPEAHERVICNRRFGQLAVAIVPRDDKPKGRNAPVSLADLVARR